MSLTLKQIILKINIFCIVLLSCQWAVGQSNIPFEDITPCDCYTNDTDPLIGNKCEEKFHLSAMTTDERLTYYMSFIDCSYPTVCDCANNIRKDDLMQEVCKIKYGNSSSMSEDERRDYYNLKRKCQSPSICDCDDLAFVVQYNLQERCYERFPPPRDSLEVLRQERKRRLCAPEDTTNMYSELELCECLNLNNNDTVKSLLCNKKFFNPSFDSEKKNQINKEIQTCWEEKQLKYINLCDCQDYTEMDEGKIKKECERLVLLHIGNDSQYEDWLNEEDCPCKEQEFSTIYSDEFMNLSLCDCMDERYFSEHKEICWKKFMQTPISEERLKELKEENQRCQAIETFDICKCTDYDNLEDEEDKEMCRRIFNMRDRDEVENFIILLEECFKED